MREVECSFCSHKQKTKSKLKRITCSSCGKKFPNVLYINRSPEKKQKYSIDTPRKENIKEDNKKVSLD